MVLDDNVSSLFVAAGLRQRMVLALAHELTRGGELTSTDAMVQQQHCWHSGPMLVKHSALRWILS